MRRQNEKEYKRDAGEKSGALPPLKHHWPVVAVGVATAGGLGLVAASLIGVGEVAIAGAAGYLAFRRMTSGTTSESETERQVESTDRKRSRAA